MYFIHCLNSGKVIADRADYIMETDSVLHIEMEKKYCSALHIASPGYNLIPLHSPRALFPHSFKDI